MYLDRCGHFRSREKDMAVTWSHHSIGHIQKPDAARKLHGSIFHRTGVTADRSLTLWEYRAVFVRFSLGGQSFDWRLATIAGMEVA